MKTAFAALLLMSILDLIEALTAHKIINMYASAVPVWVAQIPLAGYWGFACFRTVMLHPYPNVPKDAGVVYLLENLLNSMVRYGLMLLMAWVGTYAFF